MYTIFEAVWRVTTKAKTVFTTSGDFERAITLNDPMEDPFTPEEKYLHAVEDIAKDYKTFRDFDIFKTAMADAQVLTYAKRREQLEDKLNPNNKTATYDARYIRLRSYLTDLSIYIKHVQARRRDSKAKDKQIQLCARYQKFIQYGGSFQEQLGKTAANLLNNYLYPKGYLFRRPFLRRHHRDKAMQIINMINLSGGQLTTEVMVAIDHMTADLPIKEGSFLRRLQFLSCLANREVQTFNHRAEANPFRMPSV